MSTLELLAEAKGLFDQRGVVGAAVIGTTLLTQVFYSLPELKSWERPELLAGMLVLSFCTSHAFYEGLLGHAQRQLLEGVTLRSMRRQLPNSEQATLTCADDVRRFRESLFAYATPRLQRRLELHENSRRNSLYLGTSALGAAALSLVLAFVDARVHTLPWRVYLLLALLGALCVHAARYRSRVLGRDLGQAYVSNLAKARASLLSSEG
jgi:hypothetical protein